MFKKIVILSLFATTALTSLAPTRAEAGAVLFAGGLATALIPGTSGQQQVGAPMGRAIGGGVMAFVGLAAVVVGAVNFIDSVSFLCEPWPTVLIVLDADGSMKKDALTDYLAKRYGFVDNYEALSTLAQTIILKGKNMTPDAEGHVFVSLNKDEVQGALASADISPAQLDLVAADMK